MFATDRNVYQSRTRFQNPTELNTSRPFSASLSMLPIPLVNTAFDPLETESEQLNITTS